MPQAQNLPLGWMQRTAREKPEHPLEPLTLPDRARIRRLAEIYHEQMKEAQRVTGRVDEVARQQSQALRQFMIELAETDANTFINQFTEESTALEREWLARQRLYRPPGELTGMLVRVLMFVVLILALGIAFSILV